MFGGVVIAALAPTTILIVAGEASGDLHGGNLAREILALRHHIRISGVGGSQMKKAGVCLLQSVDDMAVVGISEVLFHWHIIRQTFRTLAQFIKTEHPDLVILIDYPDFNLRLAKIAKKEGIKVLYYISPQIWAWRSWRIKTIVRNVDTMLVVLPFERTFYEKSGLDVRFIGHPLVDSVKPKFNKDDAYSQFKIDPGRPVIGILPGSRHGEIRHILPRMIGAVKKIARNRPDTQFVMALAPTIHYAEIEPYLVKIKESVQILCLKDCTYDIIHLSDQVLVITGTATLEIALLNTPMILVYRVSPLSYILGKLLIRVPSIGLVNLVAGKKIVPELVQYRANPKEIASLAEKILENSQKQKIMRQELVKVRQKLGSAGSSKRAATIALEMLDR